MKKKPNPKRMALTSASTLTVERLAMAMEWQKLSIADREYARNRARHLLDTLAQVFPAPST